MSEAERGKPALSPEERAEWERFGANAIRRGETLLRNPLYAQSNCPVATGETLEVWSAKVDAWATGWRIEQAMRSPNRAGPTRIAIC